MDQGESMTDIIKCNKCNHVLVSGSGTVSIFMGTGISLSCMNCGNKYTFGQKQEPSKQLKESPILLEKENEK